MGAGLALQRRQDLVVNRPYGLVAACLRELHDYQLRRARTYVVEDGLPVHHQLASLIQPASFYPVDPDGELDVWKSLLGQVGHEKEQAAGGGGPIDYRRDYLPRGAGLGQRLQLVDEDELSVPVRKYRNQRAKDVLQAAGPPGRPLPEEVDRHRGDLRSLCRHGKAPAA